MSDLELLIDEALALVAECRRREAPHTSWTASVVERLLDVVHGSSTAENGLRANLAALADEIEDQPPKTDMQLWAAQRIRTLLPPVTEETP